jgi:hypothetical protein
MTAAEELRAVLTAAMTAAMTDSVILHKLADIVTAPQPPMPQDWLRMVNLGGLNG